MGNHSAGIGGRPPTRTARGGAIGIAQVDDTGELTFTELPRVRTHRAADRNGRYRWYNDYQLPAEHGGGTITVRLHGNDEDTKRRFNRPENVRPIAPTDPDFRRLFRVRNDAESINRGLDDTLYLRRAHSVGHRRQLVNLLGWGPRGQQRRSPRAHLARRRAQRCLREPDHEIGGTSPFAAPLHDQHA